MTGRGYTHEWQRWLPRAGRDVKIEILHEQVDLLRERIGKLHEQVDQSELKLRAEIRETEDRVVSQIRELKSDMRDERSQASQVDARGFGPIAFAILLTGFPMS